MGKILSNRDAARVESAVLGWENQIRGQTQPEQVPRQFWQQTPLKMFLTLEAADPPGNINSPVSVLAQPFEGATTPELVYTGATDTDGNPVPVQETILHTIPGLTLCSGTLVWAAWAYGAWRILFVEQWPVMVQQLDIYGFPTGAGKITLTIDGTAETFTVAATATAATVLQTFRGHSQITDPDQLQAIGGPLSGCAVNLMFGPKFTGKAVQPLAVDNSGLSPGGTGFRVRILHPLWAES